MPALPSWGQLTVPHISWFGTVFKRFRNKIVRVAPSTGETDVTFGPILEDRMYLITRFAVEDETTAPTSKIRVGVLGHDGPHWVMEQLSPAVDTLYFDEWPTHLIQGESLIARFINATSGDRLVMYVEGYFLPEQPPDIIVSSAVAARALGIIPQGAA